MLDIFSDIEISTNLSIFEDHLGTWVSEFAGNVVDNAETSFYKNLARTTKAFIKEDYYSISSVLPSWQSSSEKLVEINSLQV